MSMYITETKEGFHAEHKPDVESKELPSLPPGYYRATTRGMGDPNDPRIWLFKPKKVIARDSMTALIKDQRRAVDTVARFFNEGTRIKFEKMGLLWKTGILMEGPPGTGKSFAIMEIVKSCVAKGAVALWDPSIQYLNSIAMAARCSDTMLPIIAIYDDCESAFNNREHALLQVLDGHKSVNAMLVLGCTNRINDIPKRIWQRPSRFSEIVRFGFAEPEDAEAYLAIACKKLMSEKEIVEVASVCRKYELTLDEIKYIAIAAAAYNLDVSEVLEERYPERRRRITIG